MQHGGVKLINCHLICKTKLQINLFFRGWRKSWQPFSSLQATNKIIKRNYSFGQVT